MVHRRVLRSRYRQSLLLIRIRVKIPDFWLKRSTIPSFCRRLAIFFGGSPRSKSSTTPMRIRSPMRTSTGSVQQLDMQLWHMSLVYLAQVSRRSSSAAAIRLFFMGLRARNGWAAGDDSGLGGFVYQHLPAGRFSLPVASAVWLLQGGARRSLLHWRWL